jgi:hypothetical protein
MSERENIERIAVDCANNADKADTNDARVIAWAIAYLIQAIGFAVDELHSEQEVSDGS